MELVVRPLLRERPGIAGEYEVLIAGYPTLAISAGDRATVCRAAELRAAHGLSTRDALQVALSLEDGATAFVTNDRGLQCLRELNVFILDDFI